ncbi:MAG: ATP-binding protein [Myxococcota bacterium]
MAANCAVDPEYDAIRVEVEYPSEYASIPMMRDKFRAFLEQLDIDAEGEVGFGLMLALTECVSNVIRHAHDQDGRDARAVFEATDTVVRIYVYDTNPDKAFGHADEDAVPDLDGESGRGLFLMQSLTDSISYRETVEPLGKVVILEKALP